MNEKNYETSYLSEIIVIFKAQLATDDQIIKTKLEVLTNLNETVIINARGIKYEVSIAYFERLPSSRLGKLSRYILANDTKEIKRLCDNYKPELNEFYFNRDPFILNSILTYYQTGKLHIKQSGCVCFINDELGYWDVDEHSFESCCQITYLEKIEEINDSFKIRQNLLEDLNCIDDFSDCCCPKLREKLWNLFDNPSSSIFAKFLFVFSMFIVLFLIFNLVIKTIQQGNNDWTQTFDNIEIFCFSWSIFEIFIRFFSCPEKLKFIKKILNIIDIISVFLFFIWLFLSKYGISDARILISISRIFLLFRISRFSNYLKSFELTLKKSLNELTTFFVYLTITIVLFSSILYYCEKDSNPKFSSIPATFWWGIITITTVGYGDLHPISIAGKITTGVCIFVGMIIVSMPIGIISNNFSQVIELHKKESHFLKTENKSVKMKNKNSDYLNL